MSRSDQQAGSQRITGGSNINRRENISVIIAYYQQVVRGVFANLVLADAVNVAAFSAHYYQAIPNGWGGFDTPSKV